MPTARIPKPIHPKSIKFSALSDDEKARRIDHGLSTGRLTAAQAKAARDFWGLPTVGNTQADVHARAQARLIRAHDKESLGSQIKAAGKIALHETAKELPSAATFGILNPRVQGRIRQSVAEGSLTPYKHLPHEVAVGFAGGHAVNQPTSALGVGEIGAAFLPFLKGPRELGASLRAAFEGKGAAKATEEVVKTASSAAEPSNYSALKQTILTSTGKARRLRTEQKKLYSEERTRRAGLGEQASEHAGGGLAGHIAAKAELKGELPKLRFDNLQHLSDNEMEDLHKIVQNHPDLKFYQKTVLSDALIKARAGRVPAPYEIKLIEKAFGTEAAAQAGKLSPGQKAARVAFEAINVPRSLLASFDVSAPFRQGLVAMAAHPGISFGNFGAMFKSLVSEKKYGEIMQEIADRPSFDSMHQDGLKLTELGPLSQREEQFMSNLAEKLTGGKYGPVRASSRAYVGFLNKTRADIYDHLVSVAAEQGIETPKVRRDIARFVNVATGRGELGPLEPAAVVLNSVLFSPRLFASRINMLNPVWYARLDPFVRKQALRAAYRLIGAGTTVLGLAYLAGAKVSSDPRNADFGKMKIGNTRFDIWGGHQQIVRLLAQVEQGEIVSSTTGKKYRLAGGRSLSRQDIIKRFIEAKLAPTPSLVNDWFKGTDFAGKPFEWKRAAVVRLIPLLVQDTNDLYRDTGSIPKAAATYGIGAFGIGVQTYGNKNEPKKVSGNKNPALGGGELGGGTLQPELGQGTVGEGGFQLGGTLPKG